MRMSSRIALPMLSALCLSACASRPPLPVAVTCPQIPPPPAEMMEPPRGERAVTEIADLMNSLAELLSSGDDTPTTR